MKFDPVEILLMSVVPARVYEYCRQLVLEQSQDAKCCGAPGCSIARRVTRSTKCCRKAFVAMGLAREYAREGKDVRRPER